MVGIFAIISIIPWALGLLTSSTLGGSIHVLVVAAVLPLLLWESKADSTSKAVEEERETAREGSNETPVEVQPRIQIQRKNLLRHVPE